MRDLNINTSCEGTWLLEIHNLLKSHTLMNYTELPTRITAASSTLIDVRLLNLNENNMRLGALISDVSEHLRMLSASQIRCFRKRKKAMEPAFALK